LFLFFLLLRRPRASPLFPYTTLFRSPVHVPDPQAGELGAVLRLAGMAQDLVVGQRGLAGNAVVYSQHFRLPRLDGLARVRQPPRSEEHTSELQSQSNLVCRLLLEKKK